MFILFVLSKNTDIIPRYVYVSYKALSLLGFPDHLELAIAYKLQVTQEILTDQV